jgi:hypothetical protein
MPLRHSCFISYRHGKHAVLRQFVKQFHEALSGELERVSQPEPFLDAARLEGGAFVESTLAQGLCESACMVMIFTPGYFDPEHPWCMREFHAMTLLEKERLPLNPLNSLIIPVILSGFDRLHPEVKAQRLVYRFDQFHLGETRLSKHRHHKHEIRRIAEYIRDRREELSVREWNCAGFQLPTAHNVAGMLGGLPRIETEFPGRTDG